ncbi:MAG: type VI secretion system-associated protein TagF [Phreatobacter sp.]|uniref:type VI secretion system-associated protein TagF n=1 Tax=Phreatobacter sp. TaxID=1966341 RepID=UPI002733D334|nr:type VI secretion system-associated protein TagF [Phreatobacter sp.]MDP2801275.1 type VI secretion system-associated protein TagF [Phreatobacter sp.]
MSDTGSLIGVYGKLPAHGDFINRGIPIGMVNAWTQWLDRSLAMARHALGDYWLPTYLSSPPWRFVLDRNVVSNVAVAGVVASSVDKVRRTYPVTTFHGLAQGLRPRDLPGSADEGFAGMEAAIFEAIEGRIDADELQRKVRALEPAMAALANPGTDEVLRHGAIPDVSVGFGRTGVGLAERFKRAGGDPLLAVDGMCCWWQDGWADMPPTTIISRGLPPPDVFVGFLDGRWADRGWSKKLR